MKILILLATLFPVILNGQSISAAYSSGDIPTSFSVFDPSCNGPVTTIQITLPPGGPWQVSGIDIAYNMTATLKRWNQWRKNKIKWPPNLKN
ncbi:MAG: hypothetical protein IPL92_13695 [Saprospiraceae bacterium]|nr:hypothetical protein [Candidatus Opimibacter iunctus]